MFFYIFIILIRTKFLVETSTSKLNIITTPERPLISLLIQKIITGIISFIIFLNFSKYLKKKKICGLSETVSGTKFVDLIKVNNYEFLRFFRISHIMVENLNFRFIIVHWENSLVVPTKIWLSQQNNLFHIQLTKCFVRPTKFFCWIFSFTQPNNFVVITKVFC